MKKLLALTIVAGTATALASACAPRTTVNEVTGEIATRLEDGFYFGAFNDTYKTDANYKNNLSTVKNGNDFKVTSQAFTQTMSYVEKGAWLVGAVVENGKVVSTYINMVGDTFFAKDGTLIDGAKTGSSMTANWTMDFSYDAATKTFKTNSIHDYWTIAKESVTCKTSTDWKNTPALAHGCTKDSTGAPIVTKADETVEVETTLLGQINPYNNGYLLTGSAAAGTMAVRNDARSNWVPRANIVAKGAKGATTASQAVANMWAVVASAEIAGVTTGTSNRESIINAMEALLETATITA